MLRQLHGPRRWGWLSLTMFLLVTVLSHPAAAETKRYLVAGAGGGVADDWAYVVGPYSTGCSAGAFINTADGVPTATGCSGWADRVRAEMLAAGASSVSYVTSCVIDVTFSGSFSLFVAPCGGCNSGGSLPPCTDLKLVTFNNPVSLVGGVTVVRLPIVTPGGAPAMGPVGIVLLVLLMGGLGVLALRRMH